MFSYPHKSKTALAINKGRFLVPLLFKAITISVYSLNHIDTSASRSSGMGIIISISGVKQLGFTQIVLFSITASNFYAILPLDWH